MSYVRVPLHKQNSDIAKAAEKKNASYESFRPNIIHGTNYKTMEDRPTMQPEARVRRYPNGELDYKWVVGKIVDTILDLEFNAIITPLDAALLTVVFPTKIRKMEPQQAEIITQLSTTEKERVAAMVESVLHDQEVWGRFRGV